MKSNASLIYNIFLVVGDFLALVAGFVGAYVLRVSLDSRPVVEPISAQTYLTVFLGLLPFWIIIFALLGLYHSNIHEKRFPELGRLFIGSFIGLMFVVFWNFLAPDPIFPARLVPIYGFSLAFAFLVLFRNLTRVLRVILFSYKIGLTHVLIIGDTKLSKELVDNLINSRLSGYRVMGVVARHERFAKKYPDLPVFADFNEALEFLKDEQIHSIIQTELYADEEKNRMILDYAQTHHIGYRFTPGNTELYWKASKPSNSVRRSINVWIDPTTGLPPKFGEQPEGLILETRTILEDPLTRQYCQDCTRPTDENGKILYEQSIVDEVPQNKDTQE